MQIQFTKMHGLGNDFVVIDAINQTVQLTHDQFRFIADRKRGIGCDQILLVEASNSKDVDFRYRILNSDGSEVGQCGNGARCFAQFVRRKGLIDKDDICVETLSGVYMLRILDAVNVTVEMGLPIFEPNKIPFVADQFSETYSVDVMDTTVELSTVSVGNPHAVIVTENLDSKYIRSLGEALETHSRFPERTNVQFIKIDNESSIQQRIWERGAGETMASGSGACAAVAVGQMRGLLDSRVQVHMLGGELSIENTKDGSLFMTGPAEFSFEGSVQL